jgi:acetyl-CoA carboxylase biotin carboxyl carrier protein
MATRKRTAAASATARRWTPGEIVELAVAHDLAELEVEGGGLRVRVVRRHAEAAPAAVGAPALPAALPQPVPVSVAVEPAAGTITLEAPMVGTFYRAPSPEAAPFVNEGDLVKEGQTLCVIEAMKLMNEIEAKVAGRIVKVLAENAQPVEFGQPLFLVEPRK